MTNDAPSIQEQHLIPEADETDITVKTESVRLIAGGDVMLGRQMPGWVALHGSGWPFAGVADLLKTADLSLVNLETCISTLGDFLDKGGRQPYYYHALPEMLDVLSAMGISCVTTGNNHAMDYGREALVQQHELLEASGFLHFGSGRDVTQAAMPGYARINGLTVAFIGIETETSRMRAGADSPGIHYVSAQSLLRTITGPITMARAHADIVIVTPHWGPNWQEAPSPILREIARGIIDLGADAVLGHSAHILQGLELHGGRPIVYDMGTLLFDRVTHNRMRYTALFELELDAHGVRQLNIHPVKLTEGQAHLATGADAEHICGLLIRLSHELCSTIQFAHTGDGLSVSCTPPPRKTNSGKKVCPQQFLAQQSRAEVPVSYRHLNSNLVYESLPVDCHWDSPVIVNSELEILGARFATPVHPGRGFVCEVYFRASAPPIPSRVEARLTAFAPGGKLAFVYTHPVAEGIHPPARWNRNEIVCDRVVVRPGTSLADGSYDLYWHLRDLEHGISMQVDGTHERLVGAKVYLGKLVVSQNSPNGVAGITSPPYIRRAEALFPETTWQAPPVPLSNTMTHPSIIGMPLEQGASKLASAANPLLLDTESIARVSGGDWHCLNEETMLTGFCHNRKYLAEGSQGNFFFPLNTDAKDHSFTVENVGSVLKAFKMGAVAAAVPHSAAGLPEGLPLLRVDHVMAALEALGAHVRDHLFTGKRVIVTGTEGKTGFKCMLHHVLSPQISTHTILNSSNLDFSLYASLASIRQHDRIAILEAAGTHPGRCKQRSHIVKPHLFVITEVGNEHIMYHGSQQAVIEGKADIALGLCDGGYGILNADSRNFAAVRKAVLARRQVPLLLFGSGPECNGRLIDRLFEKNGWTVTAEIEGIRVEYRLSLLGEHAPLASVSVLLAAYHLGADIARAATEFIGFAPYESQGVLRRIRCHGGEVLLLDHATRASVLSYQSTLRTAARLASPAPDGRKVALIGQMIFLGDEAEREHIRLAEWIDDAGFDRIILVGKHTETTYMHLKNQNIVVKRFPGYDRRHSKRNELQQLIDILMENIRPGDLLFVKGEVDELGEYLRTLEVMQ